MSGIRVHGGPDARGPATHDFSTNANACGPCPEVLQRVAAADASRYPDAAYTSLREELAALHGVAPGRIALAGSASEFIFRVSGLVARHGAHGVAVPRHAYGDYAAAARAWRMEVLEEGTEAALVWTCEPSSPFGRADARLDACDATPGLLVCDRAYEPLRLEGQARVLPPHSWQLWTPNKALGLTGVRGAYAVAPTGAEALVAELEALAPSWVLGAHGVAMLQAWCEPGVQQWLEDCRPLLREWRERQMDLCEDLGWTVHDSDTNFFVAECGLRPVDHEELRGHGIRLRDCGSFGLPGHVRLAALPPQSQDALRTAVELLG